MTVKIEEAPLAIGQRCTTAEEAIIREAQQKGKGKRTLVLDSTFSTVLGAHLPSLSSLFDATSTSSWKSCLGDTEAYTSQSPVLYFPSGYRTAAQVETWCIFMSEFLNYKCRYLGEAHIDCIKYGTYNYDTCCTKSHIIVLDPQPDLYASGKRAVLSKVTLLRYLYRTDHFQKIIEPIYEMMDAGISSWDALFLSHFYAFVIGIDQYNAGRGLFYDLPLGLPLSYPRSFSDVIDRFSKMGIINHVWGITPIGNHMFTALHSNESLLFSSNAYDTAGFPFHPRGWYYGVSGTPDLVLEAVTNPHVYTAKKQFDNYLKKKEWQNALQVYINVLNGIKPMLQCIRENPARFNKILGKIFIPPYTGYSITKPYSTKEYTEDLIKFISSFDPVNETKQ